MTAEQFTELLTELRAIRAALESKPTQARATGPLTGTAFDAPVPMPEVEIDLPGALEIPFGKNRGTRLEDLPANSLRWYAGSWEPRPGDDGQLRAGDARLQNAARQLWHRKHGSAKADTTKKATQPTATARPETQEEVPF